MDKETLLKMAEHAYANIKVARSKLYEATMDYVVKQQGLKDAIAQAYANNLVQGSNEKLRDAWLRENFAQGYMEVAKAEQAEASAKHDYDQAMFDVKVVEAYLAIEQMD